MTDSNSSYAVFDEVVSSATYAEVIVFCNAKGLTLDEFLMLAVEYMRDLDPPFKRLP